MKPNNYQKDLQNIIKRYVAGKATPEETLFVERYYAYLNKNENPESFLEEENFQSILDKIATPKRNENRVYYRLAAAAVLVLSIVGSLLYYSVTKSPTLKQATVFKSKPLDVLPGKDKAILTLGNGSKIVLDENTESNISDQDGLKIIKTKTGQLIYSISNQDKINKKEIAYNTITTPKGGQYQIVLPDGSKVWLNAASSLTYPEVFLGKDRKVKLSGEAYFEVAKNKEMPFVVKTEAQDVEVLGTHFNINSYMDNQTVKTTLLEGRIKVSNNQYTQILKPGDQSIAKANGSSLIKLFHGVDTDDETAWKNGQFRFNNADLKNILNQLERWYDIKIDYNNIPQKRFNGIVPRTANLSKVLNMLEVTGNIKFKIEEDRQLKVIQ